MIINKGNVALEIWLADLRRTISVADMGPALLALQITELENKCAALRKRARQEAAPPLNSRLKKRALRSAA